MQTVERCGCEASRFDIEIKNMFDTDKFIEIIHGLPAIWDKSASEYSNKDARQRAWVNVGESMNPEWPKFTYKERDDKSK